MSFQQGLSGLNAAAKNLDVIGNNVANSNTAGFKGAQASFSDVFANSLSGGGGNSVGIGTALSAVLPQFGQGNINVTSSPLDIAINGQGFFRMTANGTATYTRNGQFQLDKDGYIVNTNGARLSGYPAGAGGTIVTSSPTDLQVSRSDLPPVATTKTAAVLNLDSRNGTLPAGSAAVPNASTVSGGFTAPIASAGGQIYRIVVGATTAFTFTSAAANDTVAAAAIDAGITANTAALTAAGYTVAGTAQAGTLAFTRADGTSFNIVVTDTMATTAGGFAGAAFATGTNTVNNGTPAVAGFNLADPTTYHSATSMGVFDSLGNTHTLSLYFTKTATNVWSVFGANDGVQIGAGALGVITFTTTGAIDATATTLPFNLSTAVATGAVTPLVFTLDLTGSTQFGASFGVNELTQDGATSGRLTGFSVGPDGVVLGRYSNGQSLAQGQIVLANFTNAQGLQPLGTNQWGETPNSGASLVGAPNSGSLGVLQSNALEESNIDLTAELVSMITAQRVYQANAQTIKTQDSVLQTLVNLR
jgi:flagellar hook protein FlgE